jgi:hypothetical protein
MKQEFKMSETELSDIKKIASNREPVMKIGGSWIGLSRQEKANNYWSAMGDKYGFKYMTVEPSSKGELYFLAEPKPIVKPKTKTEIEIDKYLENMTVKESLKKIITQLESCNYKCQGGMLQNNVAFMALKKLSEVK